MARITFIVWFMMAYSLEVYAHLGCRVPQLVAKEVVHDVYNFTLDQKVIVSEFCQRLSCTNVSIVIQWQNNTDIMACAIVTNEMVLIRRKHPDVRRFPENGLANLDMRCSNLILLSQTEVMTCNEFLKNIGRFKYFSFGRYMGGFPRFYVFECKVGEFELVNFFDRPPFKPEEYGSFPRKGCAEDFVDKRTQYVYRLFLDFLAIIDSKCRISGLDMTKKRN